MATPTDELRAIADAAPGRIWLLDWPDASATWCADPDPDGEHPDSVEYVRADRIAALEAERAAGEARVVERCAGIADSHANGLRKALAKTKRSDHDVGLFESAITEAVAVAAAIRALAKQGAGE